MVELKYSFSNLSSIFANTINRTMVELKSQSIFNVIASIASINRTMVELK